MKKKIYQVDAFTNYAYGGNPAGVMPNAEGLSYEQMRLIAQEMKLSETAFVFPGSEKEGYDYEVRFFTPTEEVDLCGHATIATFSLLKEIGMIKPDEVNIVQKTKAGVLDIKYLDDGIVIMRQAEPVNITTEIPIDELCAILGINTDDVGIEGLITMPEIWSTGISDILLPINSIDVLKNMTPSMNRLSDFSRKLDFISVHAFSLDDSKQIWCRNFAPVCGIDEESATGTSNGALGACLYSKGWRINNELSFEAHQGDWMGRPSRIFVQVKGEENPEVWVGGKAVTVLEGEITLPE